MSGTLHLTRASLRRDAELNAIASLLVPDAQDRRIAANHKLAWSLFSNDPGRKRDFLWREEAPGRLIVMSSEPPFADRRLFEVETRSFARLPETGEQLAFALRANPTISIGQSGRGPDGKFHRGKTVDVIMQALYATSGRRGPDGRMQRPLAPGRDRPFVRDALLGWLEGEDSPAAADPRRPALDWLSRQGKSRGFEIDREATRVTAYQRIALPRRRSERPAVYGEVDFEGVLTVTDAGSFESALRTGLGRAKAFGCGLILIAPMPR